MLKFCHDSIQWALREDNLDMIQIIQTGQKMTIALLDGISSDPNSKKCLNIARQFIFGKTKGEDIAPAMLICELNRELRQEKQLFWGAAIAILSISSRGIFGSNIWDVRIYIIHSQYLEQISIDHTDPFDERILTQYLWSENLNATEFDLSNPGSDGVRILLCTDGFWHLLERNLSNYHRILNFKRLWNSKKSMRKALFSGNPTDDASYVLLDITRNSCHQ